jgi:hypothetical protein
MKNSSSNIFHPSFFISRHTQCFYQSTLQTSKHPDRIAQIKAHIDHTDERINKLVYDLYGLTEEEIRIIEGREMKDEE